MSEFEKSQIVETAKSVSQWFKVSIKIEIFGHTIFQWVWPPKSNKNG